MAEHMAGALQVALRVAHVLHGLRRARPGPAPARSAAVRFAASAAGAPGCGGWLAEHQQQQAAVGPLQQVVHRAPVSRRPTRKPRSAPTCPPVFSQALERV